MKGWVDEESFSRELVSLIEAGGGHLSSIISPELNNHPHLPTCDLQKAVQYYFLADFRVTLWLLGELLSSQPELQLSFLLWTLTTLSHNLPGQ